DVVGESFSADADREHWYRTGLHACERFVERRVRRIGAVGDEHDAGERQSREIVARARERLTDARGAAAVIQLVGGLHPVCRSREAKFAENEPLRQALQQRATRTKAAPYELAPRFVLPIRNLHAARIVDDDGQEILLRYCGFQDERRTYEAENDQRDDR